MKIFAGLAMVAFVVAVVAFVSYGSGSVSVAPAVAQTAVHPPGNQDAANTGIAGVVVVTWDGAEGAEAYRVGWLNHEDFQGAGSEWLERFTFAQVPGAMREYEVTRLAPGDEYWFIVGSVDDKGRTYWPAGWIAKFRVSGVPTPSGHCPGTPSDGTGSFCPITGLRLVGEHHEIGSRVDWDRFSLTVADAHLLEPGRYHQYIGSSRLGIADDFYFVPYIDGRRFLRLTVDIVNNQEDVYLNPGREYAMDTNAGVAFVIGGWRGSPNGTQTRTELLFEIPDGASTAVLAMRPLYRSRDANWSEPELFRIPVHDRDIIPGRIRSGR